MLPQAVFSKGMRFFSQSFAVEKTPAIFMALDRKLR
jgi:hypothetical protein